MSVSNVDDVLLQYLVRRRRFSFPSQSASHYCCSSFSMSTKLSASGFVRRFRRCSLEGVYVACQSNRAVPAGSVSRVCCSWTLESVPKACYGCSSCCSSCCYGFRKMRKALLIRNAKLQNLAYTSVTSLPPVCRLRFLKLIPIN